MKKMKIVSAVGVMVLSSSAIAEGVSYNHIDVGLNYGDVDSAYLSGSLSVTDHVYLLAGYQKTRNFTPEVSVKGVGVGAHIPLSGDSDVYAQLGWGNYDGTGIDGDVDTVEIGLRSKVSEQLELNASWARQDFSVAVSGYSVTGYAYGPAVGMVYDIDKTIAITGELDRVGGDTTTSVGLRLNF